MPKSEKARATNNAWQRKNYKRLGVKLYQKDAKDFEKYCETHGKSVNSAFREYVSACLGRPLERRTAADDEPPTD